MRELMQQALRFGSVGAGATLVHLTLFVLIIEQLGTPALLANAVAFALAVPASFIGHCRFTFPVAAGRRAHGPALCKFALSATAGLALNSLLAYGVVDVLGWHYGYAIVLMAVLTPSSLFQLGRFWAFSPRSAVQP